MDDMKTELADILSSFERNEGAFSEHDVETSLKDLRHTLDKRGEPGSEELQAEEMAFGFCEDYSNTNSGWGLYFGPEFVIPQDDGRVGEWPSIHCVTAHTLAYWSARAREARHPMLRARYGGLVWEFSRRITSRNSDPEMARIVIDAVADIANAESHKYIKNTMTKLKRALALSLCLNDQSRVKRMCQTIMSYEEKHSGNRDTRVWGLSYDLLLGTKGISLSAEQEAKIIRDLEDKLRSMVNVSTGANPDLFTTEDLALRLAGYYRKTDRKDDVRRVLIAYGNTCFAVVEKCGALVGSAHLQKVHSVYVDFGLKAEADAVAVRLRAIGRRCKDELGSVSVPIEISREEIDRYVESLISDSFEKSIQRIARSYVPKLGEIRHQIQELSEKNPIMFDMPVVLQDNEGRPAAHIGSIGDDMDGRIILHMSQNMEVAAIHLRLVLQRLQERYKLAGREVADHVCKSPVFEENRATVIRLGVDAYLRSEFIVAVHLLIPQIEHAVRRLVELTGGAVYRKHRSGSLVLKTFDEILRDDRVARVLGEDTATYLRVLFTDERGWNARNNVCHGMIPADGFSSAVADRVFHALIVLCHVQSEGATEKNQ